MPNFKGPWHGIAREEIPWYPTVSPNACIGCTLCYATCGRDVYDFDYDRHLAVVAEPYNCMVGCSTCGTVCPTEAISFPDRALIQRIEREYRVIKVARKEAREKKTRQEAIRARADAEDQSAHLVERVHVQVAGEFGDKRFLIQLEGLVADEPYDIVDLRLEVPTVKGALEGTPAVMSFNVVSTTQEDVGPVMERVRGLVRANGLVLAGETMSGS
jgi:NAD-dependent dihydropyrimidine dehydrogenase PreA subunit